MSEQNDRNVFHPYPSTSLLRGVAYAFSFLLIVAAVIISIAFFNEDKILIGIMIIVGSIFIAAFSVAWILVFLNMSDDLKLLGEEILDIKRHMASHKQASISFYDAANKIMQSQLGELEDISDRQEELYKTLSGSLKSTTEE